MNSIELKTTHAPSQWAKFWSAADDADVITKQVAHVWWWEDRTCQPVSIRVLDHRYGTLLQYECVRRLDVRAVLERHPRWNWHLYFWNGSRWARIPGSIDLDEMSHRVQGKRMSPQDWETLVWRPRPQGQVVDLDFDDLPDAKEVMRRYRVRHRDVYSTVSKGKRSDIIWSIACTMAERGADANEMAAVLLESRAYQAKAEEMTRPHQWLARQIVKALKKTSAK